MEANSLPLIEEGVTIEPDVSFLIHGILNLYEHQSTQTPNMPLRELFYVVDLLRGYVESHHFDIYGSRQLILPTPQAIVFYNGKDDIPERSYLQLSDSFVNKNELSCLEFKTLVLNNNYGQNRDLMDRCKRLGHYSFFISKVRDLISDSHDIRLAINQTIDICIKKDVLSDILSKHRAEVMNMLLTEYDEAAHIANEKRWSFEDGMTLGEERGEERGIIIGLIKAYQRQGFSQEAAYSLILEDYPKDNNLVKETMAKYWKS